MSNVIRLHGLNFYLSQPSMINIESCPAISFESDSDIWKEVDRRNDHILSSVKAKDNSRLIPYSRNSFYFNSYPSYHQRPPSSTEQTTGNSSIHVNNYLNKQSTILSNHNDPTLLFGNSIIKSNKADIITLFEQQFLTGEQSNAYTNKYGVRINEDGPFWPENYRILHPTPRLLSRELTPKEFYLSPSMSSKEKQILTIQYLNFDKARERETKEFKKKKKCNRIVMKMKFFVIRVNN